MRIIAFENEIVGKGQRTLTLDQLRRIATAMETADKQARSMEGMRASKDK